MLATWITRQLVFDGVITGLLYALLAMGIVLIYRATRVINFAVGAMGLVGGALFALSLLRAFPSPVSALWQSRSGHHLRRLDLTGDALVSFGS